MARGSSLVRGCSSRDRRELEVRAERCYGICMQGPRKHHVLACSRGSARSSDMSSLAGFLEDLKGGYRKVDSLMFGEASVGFPEDLRGGYHRATRNLQVQLNGLRTAMTPTTR